MLGVSGLYCLPTFAFDGTSSEPPVRSCCAGDREARAARGRAKPLFEPDRDRSALVGFPLQVWRPAGGNGLGSLDAVPLARARELATDARQVLAEGRDPLTIKPAPKALTFGEIADQYIEAKRGEWHNAKHAAQWEMTLREYAAPIRSFAVTRSSQRTFCAA